jgi:D-aminopeptidase
MANAPSSQPGVAARRRARDLGVTVGVLSPGKLNAITDVAGVRVGHVTLVRGDAVRTGVTAILPAEGNLFQLKVPAAVYVGNGFGKLAGVTQVQELGNIETPVVLTNTLAVAPAIDALVEYTLSQPGNESVRSVNAVVGETNDGMLNDIRGRHVTRDDVLACLKAAAAGGDAVGEGNVGAGTGTVCFGYKGGIGTASRVLPEKLGGYTVGTLVQTNFGGVLHIDGVPVGRELGRLPFDLPPAAAGGRGDQDVDGSCMIVVATDAPLDSRNLHRLARRAFMGLARAGGIAANGSGDYAIAFSTAASLRVPHAPPAARVQPVALLHNDLVSPLFLAAIEATEEAIVNSLFMAEPMTGVNGARVEALPEEKVLAILERYGRRADLRR